MIVLPDGNFAMGSPKGEAGREENEGPLHDLSLRSLAFGRYPVTLGEFARFAAAIGYKTEGCRNVGTMRFQAFHRSYRYTKERNLSSAVQLHHPFSVFGRDSSKKEVLEP
jgi:formylglycine-generating enzyme required for sulfatase activity